MSSDLVRATLAATAGLSSTAKLVALCEAFGLTSKDDLEGLLETRPSTLREAKRALKNQRQNSSGDGKPAPEIQRCAGNPAKTPEIQRQESSAPSCAHATKELPSEVVIPREDIPPFTPPSEKNDGFPSHVKPIANWSTAFRDDREPPDVEFVDDRIVLRGAMLAEALADFDNDEKRLAKALDQAGGWIQPNSSRPLKAQVRAQLGKIVGDRIDRDKRFVASAPASKASDKIAAARAFQAELDRHMAGSA